MRLHWRGWLVIVAVAFFGLPALTLLGPFTVVIGVCAIAAWAFVRFTK